MVSDKNIFSCFPIYTYVKHVTPRVGPFWPQGHNLNKLSIGLLDDATDQIPRILIGLVVFKFLCRKSIITSVT